MIFLKTTLTRINGVPTSEERLLNIGCIISSENLGGSSIIKYKYVQGKSVVIQTMVLDLSYTILKKAIALYSSGHTFEVTLKAINGQTTSQSISIQADQIVDGVANGSDSVITYLEDGAAIIYLTDETLDQIIALANVDVVEVEKELDGTVTVTYDNFAAGAQSHSIDSVTSTPNTIKIDGDKTALLAEVAQVTTTGLSSTYDVESVEFTGGKTVITVTQDPAGDSGNVEWDTVRFAVGESVTDSNTGSTGEVVSDDGTTLTLKNVTGKINDNDGITGDTSEGSADADGNATYSTLDLDGNDFAGVVIIDSANDAEIISIIENPPVHPFEIRASGTTEVRIVPGDVKTLGPGAEITLQGANGDWAKFENRDGIIYELAGGQYTA